MSAVSEQNAARKRERCTIDVRRRAILEAAREVFLERGYAGASIDAIVERAGGSKATVYALFGNKEGLLAALVAECAEEIAASIDTAPLDAPIDEVLRTLGRTYLDVILHPNRIALYRLVVGESGRMPEVGDIFYRTGPRAVHSRVAEFFRRAAASGLIEAPEAEPLADYFLDAMRGDFHTRALFNPTRAPTAKEIDRHVDYVVPLFLRTCRPRAS